MTVDEFFRDIIEFYSDPENIRALEEYRKARESAEKGGDSDDGTRNMGNDDALQDLPA